MDRVHYQPWFQACVGDLENDPHEEEYAYSLGVKSSKFCILVLQTMTLITERESNVMLTSA